jgi:hypothetical protein
MSSLNNNFPRVVEINDLELGILPSLDDLNQITVRQFSEFEDGDTSRTEKE